ncbi:MAG: DUF2442 domain-containing protein [Bacteroidetes bacterium]|nr:MAG: DUF2442 domain-containing protein [Bacteroidota bacterium]
MNHSIYKINNVKVIQPYIVEVLFSTGEKRIIDLEPVLYGPFYSPLRDVTLFKRVIVNHEVHTIEWPNGADFDPATLYNWDIDREEISQRLKELEMV